MGDETPEPSMSDAGGPMTNLAFALVHGSLLRWVLDLFPRQRSTLGTDVGRELTHSLASHIRHQSPAAGLL